MQILMIYFSIEIYLKIVTPCHKTAITTKGLGNLVHQSFQFVLESQSFA